MTTIIADYQRTMEARADAREADRERHKQARRRFERSLLRSPEQLAEDARCRKAFRQRGIDAYRLVTRDEFLDN